MTLESCLCFGSYVQLDKTQLFMSRMIQSTNAYMDSIRVIDRDLDNVKC